MRDTNPKGLSLPSSILCDNTAPTPYGDASQELTLCLLSNAITPRLSSTESLILGKHPLASFARSNAHHALEVHVGRLILWRGLEGICYKPKYALSSVTLVGVGASMMAFTFFSTGWSP